MPGYQVAPRSIGTATVSPAGSISMTVKSSVSLTKVEWAVRYSVYAMFSAAARQWLARTCNVTLSIERSEACSAMSRLRGKLKIEVAVDMSGKPAGDTDRGIFLDDDGRAGD